MDAESSTPDIRGRQRAVQYGRSTQAISQFSARNKDEILAAKLDMTAEIAGQLWGANKDHRIVDCVADLDDLNVPFARTQALPMALI
jgi:hypothetical protein